MSSADCGTCDHRCGNHEDNDGPCTVRFGRPSDMNICPCTAFDGETIEVLLRTKVYPRLIQMPNGCLEWPGAKRGAYGIIMSRNRDQLLVHRLVYEHEIGPIPDGLVIDHLCRNTLCANAAHLEAVTIGENVLRGTGPSALNAVKTHCVHGHEYAADNTYLRPNGDRECRTCRRTQGRERKAAARAKAKEARHG